jgi:GTP-binding protein LepA
VNEIIKVSAKTGEGVEKLIDAIITELPAPNGKEDVVPRVMIFNSIYHQHLGVIAFSKVVDGSIVEGMKARLIQGNNKCEIKELGIFTPERKPLLNLETGCVGYVATGVKDIRSIQVGDTLTLDENKQNIVPLPGFKVPKPVVFADIFPGEEESFNKLKYAVEQLKLMDAALSANQIHSPALGSGFRLGFLGLFHTEITRERLKREMNVETIISKPTVEYEVELPDKIITIHHASELPNQSLIHSIREPMVQVKIIVLKEYLGSVMQLIQDRRGKFINTTYYGNQAQLVYELPLVELISGFVDDLKSASQGYASLDYQHIGNQKVDAIKLTILLNHEEIQSLSRIVVKNRAESEGRDIVKKLKELLPKQLFAIPIQAAIGGKIIARETKPAARKDVTAKLYGGDVTRRMKLLEKQKKGKKKLALKGQVQIPENVYTSLLRV